jgi:hypothetical protein
MECFLRVAEANTKRSLETCGVLAGTLVCTFPKENKKSDLTGLLNWTT